MKKLIVLNDGTDEIFNLHMFVLKGSRADFCNEWMKCFMCVTWTGEWILEREWTPEEEYDPLFSIVDRDASERCRFLLTEEALVKVEERVMRQNEYNEKYYKEEDFDMSWSQTQEELGWKEASDQWTPEEERDQR